uniref:S-layer protein n=3 Tax=Methanothermococcus thermolithotrophicus TaxID=2186 RepID=UPI0021DFBC60|nr:S-layer protein [Methanothermococcus thermolithotrophicus]
MAMSLKKIGAIAVGGAMVASALASGVMAATTSGDVAGFMKNAIKEDGTPNVDIVVGSGAATMDVISAADVAAKIGSMAYKTGVVDTGSAKIKVSAKAESDDVDVYNLDSDSPSEDVVLVAAADSDYAKGFITESTLNVNFTDADYPTTNIVLSNGTVDYINITTDNYELKNILGSLSKGDTVNIDSSSTNITKGSGIVESITYNGSYLKLVINGTLVDDTTTNGTKVTNPDWIQLVGSATVKTFGVTSNDANIDLKNDHPTDGYSFTSLGDVSTMLKVTDIDPSDWFDSNDNDAGEVVFAKIVYDSDKRSIDEDQLLYASIAYKNDEEVFNDANTVTLKPGMRIPFLGEEYAVVKIDADDDIIYLGKEAKDGVLKEGETFAVGNGYEVKVASILKSGSEYKATVQVLKDGKVVKEKTDTVSNTTQLTLAYKDVGVVVNDAWEDIAGTTGYAEVLITKDTKALELGEEYIPDWEAWAALNVSGKLDIKKDITESDKANVVGIALKYVGDKKKKLDDGDEINIADYLKLVFDDEDKNNVLKVKFLMDESKEVTLNIGQKETVLNAEVRLKDILADAQQAVKLTAPIAKLDSEVSLDTADKNLILVGGPVVNALTKELVDAGKVAIDNESPAMLVAVPDAANGNDVLVVAGGDREATREAAKALLEMI